MQPIDPPLGGGRLRLLGLYHALGAQLPTTYVGTYDWPGESRRQHALSSTLQEIDVPLSDAHFALLDYACTWHTHGKLSDDPTIGTCWDADRLDLGRVGMQPKARYMSTTFGREIAADGDIQRFIRRVGAGGA